MKENTLKLVLLVLVGVVLIQAYYLYDMNRDIKDEKLVSKHELFPEPRSFETFFDDKDDPFAQIEEIRRDMEKNFRDFENFFQTTPAFEQFSSEFYRVPRFDMKEQGDRYIITMELPGSNNRSIDVKVKNYKLSVDAKVMEEKDDNTTTYHRHERRTGRYKHSIMLPEDADEKSLHTDYKDGLLIITIKKKKSL